MIVIMSALLFSLASNLDNIVIGIAYGIKNIKIDILPNLLIAVITTTGTFIAMSIGTIILQFLPLKVTDIIGSVVLMILGVYFVIQSNIKERKKRQISDVALKDLDEMIDYAVDSDLDKSGDISLKEAVLVAIGLCFNNLGTGIAASVSGVNLVLTLFFTFSISIVTIVVGVALGNHIVGKILGRYAPLISGILLIILAIFGMFF